MLREECLPLRQGLLHRPRIHTLIEGGLQSPILFMLAGPGYGKTQAMIDYMHTSRAKMLWLRLSSLDNLPPHFMSHLTQALRPEFPQAAKRIASLGFPTDMAQMDALVSILSADIGPDAPAVWVFDDFGEINDPQIKDFLQLLAGAQLEGLQMALLSNITGDSESAAFMAGRRTLLQTKDLRFTQDEIAALFHLHGMALEPEAQASIEHYSEGWPLILHSLTLQHAPKATTHFETHPISVPDDISFLFDARFFQGYSLAAQRSLIKLALLPSFTRELAAEICEEDISTLALLENHVFLTDEPSSGRLFFHHLYCVFLQKKLYLVHKGEVQRVWKTAAAYHMRQDNPMDAIACSRNCGDHIGMLHAIIVCVTTQYGLTEQSAAYFLEHLALLTPEEVHENPIADCIRALIYICTMEFEKAEPLLESLEQKLCIRGSSPDASTLKEVHILQGLLHMLRSQEDFPDFFKKANACGPDAFPTMQNRSRFQVHNNHCFFMADNRHGAKEQMEQSIDSGMHWLSKLTQDGLSGLKHIFSAEAACLSLNFQAAEQHAYRGIYQAEAAGQHDLACSGYCVLAYAGMLSGELGEATRQVNNITQYALRHSGDVTSQIRDTLTAWYYIHMNEPDKVPASIVDMNEPARPILLTYSRAAVIYASYLLCIGQNTKLIGLLEHPRGEDKLSGIRPGPIMLRILLAVAYMRSHQPGAAVEALWAAYNMAFSNGLSAPFVEAGDAMCDLLTLARAQTDFVFDPVWLAHVEREAENFATRRKSMRNIYRKKNPKKPKEGSPLTHRETEILRALTHGLTREEIAHIEHVSVNTVKTILRNIYGKLKAANSAEAVSIAIAHGYIGGELSE